MPVLTITAVLLSLAGAGGASDAAYRTCMADETSNAGFAECGAALVRRKEAALTAAWTARYAALDVATRKALLAEQRLWIRYKDASCSAWTKGYFGREGQVIDFYLCRAGVIAARIDELNALAGDED